MLVCSGSPGAGPMCSRVDGRPPDGGSWWVGHGFLSRGQWPVLWVCYPVMSGWPGCLIPWVRPQGGISDSPDASVAPLQPERRCSSGRLCRSSCRARGVQLLCSVTGARPSPGRLPAGESVKRVPRRAWQWQAGGRLRISGGGLSRIPLSLGIAFGLGGQVRLGS
jgi:hypothetical protein